MKELGEVNKKSNSVRMLNIFLIQYFDIVIIFIIAIFILLSVFFILVPKYNDIQEGIEVSNEKKKIQKDALVAYDKRLDLYISSFEKIKELNKQKLSVLLPDKDLKENLLTQFEEIARRKGLLLTSLSIDTPDIDAIINPKPNSRKVSSKNEGRLPAGVGSVGISMNLVGLDYESFKEFLQMIEKSLRIMDINNLSFDNSSKTLTVDMTTYFNYFDRLKKE